MKLLFLFWFILISVCGYSQQVRIGVYRDYAVKRINFAYADGSYSIYGDSIEFGSLLPNEFVELSVVGNKVRLKLGVVDKGTFTKVLLIQNKRNSSINLVPKSPLVKQRKYKDDFEIFSNGKDLTLVNVVDLNNYLAGVVESEGGGGRELEYYKVQALMSRTYALKYKKRHAKEGFSLCDRVHCQAYHSMMRFTPSIDRAIEESQGMVMIDSTGKLVDSYFHANCGGQTCEPDYVWNNSIPYLVSFKDTFCIYTRQAKWEKRVSQSEWKYFLVKNYGYPIGDSLLAQTIYTFNQEERKAFYIHPVLGIPLRDLRQKFNLKSTYFSTYPDGNEVVIQGRGFGHGVGLCQEGAMKMAAYGFNYQQIALFYFPGVFIVDMNTKSFFGQEGSSWK